MTCPDHNLLVAFAEGRLDDAARAPVEEHLDRCPECRAIAAELARSDDDAREPGDGPTWPDLGHPGTVFASRVRQTVGAYQIGARLGEGGMGVVYRARQGDDAPEVALKCVLAADCDDLTRRRFAREASTVRGLDHPNVVRVLDWGETDAGMLFLAMELLDGEDLASRLRHGPLDPTLAARLAAEAADGVAAAHELGIAHRDIKPANLFSCTDGRVKVLDFGLAVPFGRSAARFTGRGALVGTPAFMSAEQARGAGNEDARTDVWGLGATLYFALAGRPPFEARSATSQLVRIATEPADPLPAHVPDWLVQIVLRCLEKEPGARFASMAELGAALRRGLGRGTAAPPPATSSALSEEIRVVAVLYAEEVEEHEAFAAAVQRHGGVASALFGGRAVGVFGGELWLGDEPLRAVRAGLDARAAAAAVWLGVSTGHSVRARRGVIVDEVVGSARAVLAHEGVGADAEMLRRVRGGFDVRPGVVLAERRGQRALAAAACGWAMQPLGAGELQAGDAPVFGRDAERAAIGAALREALRASAAGGVLLVGPLGIGKTCLLRAVEWDLEDAHLTAPVTRLEARGEASRALEPWHTLGAALRATLHDAASAPAALTALGLPETSAARLADLLGALPSEAPRVEEDPRDVHDAIVAAFGDWLDALTRRAPVLLVVEDADRADRASLRAITAALRRLGDRPIFVLAAARDDLDALGELRRFVLEALPPAAGRALIRSVLGEADPRVEALWQRSGGHPLFAVELALAARQGVVETPASVEAAVQSRLDGLPRAEKNLLRRAAAIGVHFWVEGLEAIGQTDAALLLASVRRHDVVAPEPSSRLAGTREWRFRHTLLRDVVHGSLTEDQRRTLHESIGRWLAGRPDAPAVEVAHHLEQGASPDAAAPFWSAAAASALRQGEGALALEASARALAFETSPTRLFTLRLIRVDALHILGVHDGVEEELEALAAASRTPAERAAECLRRSRSLRTRGRAEEAAAVARAGLAEAGADVPLLAEASLALSEAGHVAEAAETAEAACVEARVNGAEPFRLGRALNALGMCRYRQGDIGRALDAFEEALEALRRAGHPRHVAGTLGRVGYCLLAVGCEHDAAVVLEQSRQLAHDAGLRIAEAYALHNLGLAIARRGDVAEGLRLEHAALAMAHELSVSPLVGDCGRALANILYEAGRYEEAAAALAEVPLSAAAGSAELETLQVMVLLARGRTEEARPHLQAALALRDAVGLGELESELFLAAHALGTPGALSRGMEALAARARGIRDPERRRRFLEVQPANARLRAAARKATS